MRRHFLQEGGSEALLVHGLMADMAVEVAIGALGSTERPMHVDPETGLAGVGQKNAHRASG
jgi:hypothetical protein